MTREEAIKVLNNFPIDFRNSGGFEAMEALKIAILALRPVSRERVEEWRGVWVPYTNWWEFRCSICRGRIGNIKAYDFCPHCGAPMTDEAVEMVMERLEALYDKDV